jgi:hypothetical protein
VVFHFFAATRERRWSTKPFFPVEMKERKNFAEIFSAAGGPLRAPEIGQRAAKKFVASGNDAVFRGSVQHLRAVCP